LGGLRYKEKETPELFCQKKWAEQSPNKVRKNARKFAWGCINTKEKEFSWIIQKKKKRAKIKYIISNHGSNKSNRTTKRIKRK
jgi:hypothetical protein